MPERRKNKNSKLAKHVARKAKRAGSTTKKAAAKKKTAATKTAKSAASAKGKAAAASAQKEGQLSVYDQKGKSLESVKLDPIFQDGKVNTNVVYQAVLMYQANSRLGTAATKTRGEVRGGGKKPWKQKGTGQARHGSRRSPIWRGGGVTFGPHPRDYSYEIPAQVRRLAVVEVVKDKVQNGKMYLLDKLELESPKTRLMAGVLEAFKLERPIFVVESKSPNVMLASRNIPDLAIKTASEVNALDLALHRECLMTKAAYTGLVKRLKS